MKLKDFVFDSDKGVATLWLEEVHPIQLRNLLMILQDDPEPQDEMGYDTVIFGEE